MVPIWRFLETFRVLNFSASRVQRVSDLHPKFALYCVVYTFVVRVVFILVARELAIVQWPLRLHGNHFVTNLR